MRLEFKTLTGAVLSAVGLSTYAQTGASAASGVPGSTLVVVPPGGPTWLIAGAVAGVIVGFALGVLFMNRRR